MKIEPPKKNSCETKFANERKEYKRTLFDGLEEDDKSMYQNFTAKPKFNRLLLKRKITNEPEVKPESTLQFGEYSVANREVPVKSVFSMYRKVLGNMFEESVNAKLPQVTSTRPGYYTVPALSELHNYMDQSGNCVVHDFIIGRENFGKLVFKGPLNITGLNLDEIVLIEHQKVVLYPNDSKPAIGQGLNRGAEVTLYQVWPQDNFFESFIETSEMTFVDYQPATGTFIFKVNHF